MDRKKWNKSKYDFDIEYPDTETEDQMETNRFKQQATVLRPTSNPVVDEEIRKRYENYLINLQINNKVRKLVNENNPKDKKLKNLEGGFNLYVNGAHKAREKYTPRYLVTSTKPQDKQIPNLDLNFLDQAFLIHDNSKFHSSSSRNSTTEDDSLSTRRNCKSAAAPPPQQQTTRRKHWVNSSVIIKTMDGCKIKLTRKGNKNTELNSLEFNENYSDDFDTDDDEEEKIEADVKLKNKQKKECKLIGNVKFLDSNTSESDGDDCVNTSQFTTTYDRKTFEEKFLKKSTCIDDVLKSIQIDESFASNSFDSSSNFNINDDMKIVTMSQLLTESSQDFEIDASKFKQNKNKN